MLAVKDGTAGIEIACAFERQQVVGGGPIGSQRDEDALPICASRTAYIQGANLPSLIRPRAPEAVV
jgi:hypothetical protein